MIKMGIAEQEHVTQDVNTPRSRMLIMDLMVKVIYTCLG